jgi:hypothetical protein
MEPMAQRGKARMGPASRVRRLALVADLWMLTRVTQGEPDKHETLKICGPSIFTFGRLEVCGPFEWQTDSRDPFPHP